MGAWEHLTYTVHTNELDYLSLWIDEAGASGFELCGIASPDKTIGLNAIVAVMKRPGRRRPPPDDRKKAAWHADPYGRFQYRWWQGLYWTSIVNGENGEEIDVPGD